MRLPPTRALGLHAAHLSSTSLLRASASTTVKRFISSPTPPPPSSSTSSLLPLAVSKEVGRNSVLWKAFAHRDTGSLLAELGRSLGSDTGLDGVGPSPSDLEKVVKIHRALKEVGIRQKDLRITMDKLVGLGLFDSHQPLLSPPPSSSSLPSSPSPPTPSSSVPKVSLKSPPPHKSSSPSSSLLIVDSARNPPVAGLAGLQEGVAGLEAKLNANPTSPHRQEWTKHLEILQARISATRSGVKTVSKPRKEITAGVERMENLDMKDGGDRVETQRRLVLERLNALEARKEAGLGVSSSLRRGRLEWKILQERSTAGRKKDASESNGSSTSASLPAPRPPPPAFLTTTCIRYPPTSKSSPLPSPSFTSRPSLPPLLESTPTPINSQPFLPPSPASPSLPPSIHEDPLKASDDLLSQWKHAAAALKTKLHSKTDATEETRATWRRNLAGIQAGIESGRRMAPLRSRERYLDQFRAMVVLDSQDGGRRFEGRRDLVLECIRSSEKEGTQLDTKEWKLLEKNRVQLALLEEFARGLAEKDDASGSINSSFTAVVASTSSLPPPPPLPTAKIPNTLATSTSPPPPRLADPTSSPSPLLKSTPSSVIPSQPFSSSLLTPTSPSPPPPSLTPESTSPPILERSSSSQPSPPNPTQPTPLDSPTTTTSPSPTPPPLLNPPQSSDPPPITHVSAAGEVEEKQKQKQEDASSSLPPSSNSLATYPLLPPPSSAFNPPPSSSSSPSNPHPTSSSSSNQLDALAKQEGETKKKGLLSRWFGGGGS